MLLIRSLRLTLMLSLGVAVSESLSAPAVAAQTRDTTQARLDTTHAQPEPTQARPDSVQTRVERKPPLGPSGAFLRSFIVPGWAQLQLHRPVSALVFVGIEGAMVGLSLKANHDVKVARLTDQSADSSVVQAKKKKREDWLVLLGFNHLMAGLEAYVASHLYDFPGDLHIRATPSTIGASASVPFRIR